MIARTLDITHPAAVRRVDLEQLADLNDLAGYRQCFVVYRHQGSVIGTAVQPVRNGAISADELHAALAPMGSALLKLSLDRPTEAPLPSATVAVCTRDRTEDLARCIPGLCRIAAAGHEVLVIDSGPSDNRSADLVAGYPALRYIRQNRPGLDIARNTALLHAQGEIVAFTDDDAIVDDEWLDALRAGFADPLVALVTGITMPLELETPAQLWFERTNGFHRGYARRSFDSDYVEPLGSGMVGAGVNMAIRRSALNDIGLFDPALDGGTAALSGGDQEFFYRVLARGYRAIYSPAALVWHRHRRDWDALRRTIYGYGVGLYAWWTRALLIEGEVQVLKNGSAWFVEHHVRELLRALARRPGAVPLDLAWAEFSGALRGPAAYIRARREATRAGRPDYQHAPIGHYEVRGDA